jgi:ribosome-associated heat shock protein Hsp15
MTERASADKLRIDKWLWAARFFKTRSLATEAVNGGKVQVNGESTKPARPIKIGDELRIRLGEFEHVVIVRGLAERRGPASVAQTLYEETEESRARRARLREQLKLSSPLFVYDQGRPTKKDRRELDRFRRDKHR